MSTKQAVEHVKAALDAASLAEAWPDDGVLHQKAIDALTEAMRVAMPEMMRARGAASDTPLVGLCFNRVYNLRNDPFVASREVGELMIQRITAQSWWPRRLFRIAWLPMRPGSNQGAVLAWFANLRRVEGAPVPLTMVSRDHACLTPFAMGDEVIFRMKPNFTFLMMSTDTCELNGVPALSIHALGAGTDLDYARRVAARYGETGWNEHRIEGAHVTWAEIMAAGGPARNAGYAA